MKISHFVHYGHIVLELASKLVMSTNGMFIPKLTFFETCRVLYSWRYLVDIDLQRLISLRFTFRYPMLRLCPNDLGGRKPFETHVAASLRKSVDVLKQLIASF